MDFEEWFKSTAYTDRDCAEEAWKAAYQEGFDDGYDSCQEERELL